MAVGLLVQGAVIGHDSAKGIANLLHNRGRMRPLANCSPLRGHVDIIELTKQAILFQPALKTRFIEL